LLVQSDHWKDVKADTLKGQPRIQVNRDRFLRTSQQEQMMNQINKRKSETMIGSSPGGLGDYFLMIAGVSSGMATFLAVLASIGSLGAGEPFWGFIAFPFLAAIFGGLFTLFARADRNFG